MKQYKSHLKVIGFLTGLMMATLLLTQCVTVMTQKAEYKTLTKYNNAKTDHFNIIVPVHMPDFTVEPWEYESLVPLSYAVAIMTFTKGDDFYSIATFFDKKPIVFGLYGEAKKEWYIYTEVGGFPILSSEEEYLILRDKIISHGILPTVKEKTEELEV